MVGLLPLLSSCAVTSGMDLCVLVGADILLLTWWLYPHFATVFKRLRSFMPPILLDLGHSSTPLGVFRMSISSISIRPCPTSSLILSTFLAVLLVWCAECISFAPQTSFSA